MRWNVLVRIGLSVCLASGAAAWAQDTLGLDDALQMARERNGDVRAAFLNVQSAKARVDQSLGAFYPSVTPVWRWDSSRQTGPNFPGAVTSDGSQSEISATWRLFDSGQRNWSLGASRASAQAQVQSTIQTVRQILFTVHQQYYDALRAEELFRVAEAQVARAENVLAQTEAQVKVGDAPEKDVYQARADYLNAKVQQLVARNRRSTAQSALKATIVWNVDKPLPPLEQKPQPETFAKVPPLDSFVQRGMKQRPDLIAERLGVEVDRSNASRAEREASFTWTLDATYNRSVTPDVADGRFVTFLVSLPLFDGGQSRAAARGAQASLAASKSSLSQSERAVESEIESAHAELVQNTERVTAAQLAVEAARKNYEAAVEAQRLGAAGTNVVTVSTALVSLVTAESNYVEAVYDYYISDVRLRVATGDPIQGEAGA